MSRARLWEASLVQAGNGALRRRPGRRRRRASGEGRAAQEASAARPGELWLWRRLARQARACSPHLAGLAVLSLLATPLALLTPVPLKIAVDNVIGDEPLPGVFQALLPGAAAGSETSALVLAAILLVAIAVARQLQELGTSYLRSYTGEKLVLGFRADLFRRAQQLSLTYHDSRGTADSTYRIQSDAAAVRYIAVDGLIPLLAAVVTLVAMVYVTARISWQLALVAVAVAPVLLLIGWVYRRRLRSGWREVKGIESATLGVVQEVLTSLRIVKVFGQEERERERFLRHSHEGMRARVRLALTEGGFGLLIGVTTAGGTAAVLVIGVRQVQEGALTLGSLLLVMAYLAQLYEPVRTIGSKTASLQSHLASAERAFALLDEATEVPEQTNPLRLAHASGAVTFRNVSFSYGDGSPVLDRVSFEVAPGTRLGISGATGAGKTTLVNLLTRFFDPTEGAILLDGYDLRAYRLADLRRQFGIALQDPLLFSASIAENIAYARPKASPRDVVRAAKAANADSFIRALPQGYETQVGERGLRLSGGERQRIALARAFLKNAPILILDEPTSSVDSATEAEMIEAMERLSRGRTAFVIAHRPSTLEICEAKLELEHGRVVGFTPPDGRGAARARPRVRRSGTGSTGARARRGKKPLWTACDPVGHPVVGAWRQVAPTRAAIDRIERRRSKEIYRLTLAGGTGVVAKHAAMETLLLERTIYENVLPRLPTPALRCFGLAEDESEGFAWLFIEDLGDERCSLAEHGRLAARWLGTLHGAAADLDLGSLLPERGPKRYLGHLHSARRAIMANFDNAAFGADDRSMLRELLATCDRIESRWSKVEAICSELPRTLVHGDLVARNLRLYPGAAGPGIVAFDWECSGVGVPAADVYELAAGARRRDLVLYRSTIAEYTPGIDEDRLQALLLVGNGFRLLASVDWATPYLRFSRPQRGTETLRCYERPLREWSDGVAAVA